MIKNFLNRNRPKFFFFSKRILTILINNYIIIFFNSLNWYTYPNRNFEKSSPFYENNNPFVHSFHCIRTLFINIINDIVCALETTTLVFA